MATLQGMGGFFTGPVVGGCSVMWQPVGCIAVGCGSLAFIQLFCIDRYLLLHMQQQRIHMLLKCFSVCQTLPLPLRNLNPHGSLGPHNLPSIWYLDRFSHFCKNIHVSNTGHTTCHICSNRRHLCNAMQPNTSHQLKINFPLKRKLKSIDDIVSEFTSIM